MNKISRREFFKNSLALAATLFLSTWLPKTDEKQAVELVDFEIDDLDLRCCLKVNHSKPIVNENGEWCAEVFFDIERAFDLAYFVDTNGNQYPYREIERLIEAAEAGQPMDMLIGYHEYDGVKA